jgi:ABC-type uncharacterized transport system substrate-binding protein
LAARGGAQQSEKIPRIGYLSPAGVQPRDEAFRQRLQELGYVEGKTIIVERRFAEGKFERLPTLAEELVRLEVDVIVTAVTQASLAAKYATRTIPIVFAAVSDPLGSGLVASLARPGANVTGTAAMSSDVVGKSLEILREAVPALSRVAVIWNPDNAIFQAQMLRDTQLAAGRLEIELRIVALRGPDDFEPAFSGIAGTQAGALMVLSDPAYTPHAARIADLVNKSRLPAMYSIREYAAAGGLMAYGTNFTVLFRRRLRRQDTERYQACGSTGGAAHQVRVRYQPQGRQGHRPDHTPNVARTCRRGDRIGVHVRYWPKADIPSYTAHVRF